MRKTLSTVSEEYENLVREVFAETGLENAVNLKVFAMARPGKEVVKIIKAPELAEMAYEEDDIIAVIIYEEAFDLVDEPTRKIWVENALSQVSYDYEKCHLNIGKEPSLNITLGMYDKYKDILVQKMQLAALTIQQIKDAEKEKKASKKNKKNL